MSGIVPSAPSLHALFPGVFFFLERRRRGGRRSEGVEANLSVHLHAQFKNCLLISNAVCTVSASSLVQGCNTLKKRKTCVCGI